MKELFNLRNSSLRTVVERAFGVLKWRFPSLRLARKRFSIRTQVKIGNACAALHNWMIDFGKDLEEAERQAAAEGVSILNEETQEAEEEVRLPEGLTDDERRDKIAEYMWACHVEWREGLVYRSIITWRPSLVN
jgi:hypothetical protein